MGRAEVMVSKKSGSWTRARMGVSAGMPRRVLPISGLPSQMKSVPAMASLLPPMSRMVFWLMRNWMPIFSKLVLMWWWVEFQPSWFPMIAMIAWLAFSFFRCSRSGDRTVGPWSM